MTSNKVDILLATCNGERFIQEQVSSILNQSYPHLSLIICDDQSTDQTPIILAELAKNHPERIKIISAGRKLGVNQCFSFLLEHIENDYLMFADQDDVWLKHKVENAMESIQILEKQYGCDIPLLVHSNLKVVDAKLEVLSDSFWSYSNLFPKNGSSLNRLIVQNAVTGCSLLMNRALVNKAMPIPEEAIQHDWWIALVAAAFGYIKEIEEPSILYRQHTANAVGAIKYNPFVYFYRRMKTPLEVDKAYRIRNMNQTKTLNDRYSTTLTSQQKMMLGDYLNLINLGFFRSIFITLKHGFYKHGFSRNAIGLIPKGIFSRLKKKVLSVVAIERN